MRPFTLFVHYGEHRFSHIYPYPSFRMKLCIIILGHFLKILRRNKIFWRLEVWIDVRGLKEKLKDKEIEIQKRNLPLKTIVKILAQECIHRCYENILKETRVEIYLGSYRCPV